MARRLVWTRGRFPPLLASHVVREGGLETLGTRTSQSGVYMMSLRRMCGGEIGVRHLRPCGKNRTGGLKSEVNQRRLINVTVFFY